MNFLKDVTDCTSGRAATLQKIFAKLYFSPVLFEKY